MKQKKYFFLHIPKTAGTSLIKIFNDVLGSDNVKHVTSEADNISSQQARVFDEYTLIAGHLTAMQFQNLFAKERYSIVFLRNPIDRFVSLFYFYKFIVNSTSDRFVKIAKDNDLDSFITICQQEKNISFCNLQTWHMTGIPFSKSEFIEKAKENLVRMNFVGIYEFFADSIDMLCYDCQWPPIEEIPLINVTTNRPALQDLDPRITEQIRELNYLDFELYEYGLKLFNQKKREIMLDYVRKNHEMARIRLSSHPIAAETLTGQQEIKLEVKK